MKLSGCSHTDSAEQLQVQVEVTGSWAATCHQVGMTVMVEASFHPSGIWSVVAGITRCWLKQVVNGTFGACVEVSQLEASKCCNTMKLLMSDLISRHHFSAHCWGTSRRWQTHLNLLASPEQPEPEITDTHGGIRGIKIQRGDCRLLQLQ